MCSPLDETDDVCFQRFPVRKEAGLAINCLATCSKWVPGQVVAVAGKGVEMCEQEQINYMSVLLHQSHMSKTNWPSCRLSAIA